MQSNPFLELLLRTQRPGNTSIDMMLPFADGDPEEVDVVQLDFDDVPKSIPCSRKAELALGRVLTLPLLTKQPPSTAELAGGAKWPEYRSVRQVTIKTLYLAPSLRGHGHLRGLLEHLRDTLDVQAVQIQAVVSHELRARLFADPRWVCQAQPENCAFNPSFVWFIDTTE